MQKIVAIIQARLASTRLPNKVMLPLLGAPMLERMVERLQNCTSIADIVIATARGCTPIVELAYRLDVGFWEGSEEDVLGRVLEAARFYEADVIVELTGDCPLIDPAMVDKVVADYLLGGADFVTNQLPYTAPRGMDVRVFATDKLAELDRKTQEAADREHCSLYFWEHPLEYIVRNVSTGCKPFHKDYRLTVDTQEDYALVCNIFEALYPIKPDFNLFDILHYLDTHPEAAALNRHVKQKAVR